MSLMPGSSGWRSTFDNEHVILPCGSSSLIYGGTGPPPLWRWCGSSSPTTMWMHGACRHGGPRAWEARPQRQPPPTRHSGLSDGRRRPPSSTSGGVYEGQIVDSGLDMGLAVIDLGSRFFVIKNCLLMSVDSDNNKYELFFALYQIW
jgi:hypothetical protein